MLDIKCAGLIAMWRVAIVIAAAVTLTGCGAGETATTLTNSPVAQQPADTTRGSLEFRVSFPTAKRGAAAPAKPHVTRGNGSYDGSVPLGSHSVKITLTDPVSNTLLALRIVSDTQRPDGVTGVIVVGFPLLRAGAAKIDIAAFASTDATGAALATGTGNATITANTTTEATVNLTLTLSKLVAGPPTQPLHTFTQGVPATVVVDAQATDSQGNPLLYPLEYSSDNPQVADITAITPDFMHATIGALQTPKTPQPVTITVTEPNSGMTASAIVVVQF